MANQSHQRPVAGSVFTFYSYKGGVGRTLALANVAALLAGWGYRVLCVDWDLEAPGLALYFKPWLDGAVKTGLLELFERQAEGRQSDWPSHVTEVRLPSTARPVHLIAAGREDASYVRRVQRLDWGALYTQAELGPFLEELRDSWKAAYDLVLIDSRTGITDIGGICTIQLPDFLVAFFTANEQSVRGVLDVATRATDGRNALPVERARLATLPIVSRFEGSVEFKQTRKWLDLFEELLPPVVSSWLHQEISVKALLDHVKVPYVAHWSFGEPLTILEEGTTDPLTISYAFETLAALVANRLNHTDVLVSSRPSYIESAAGRAPLDVAARRFEQDAFVSFQPGDEGFAHKLEDELRSLGIHATAGLDQSLAYPSRGEFSAKRFRHLVVVLSQLPDKGVEEALRQFIRQASLEEAPRLVLPVTLQPAMSVVPRALARFRWIEGSERTHEDVAEEVAEAIRASESIPLSP